jgi:hypothetical protein
VQLQADRAGADLLDERRGVAALPLPRNPTFTGSACVPSNIRCRFHSPGVQVVARVPSAGPVPPPIIVVTPL